MGSQAGHDAARLLSEAREGAPECLGRLLARYGNYLKLLVASQLDERLRARCSPSDVVQETYCDAHRDFSRFRGATEAEFLAWLRTILAHNMAREVEKHVLAAKRDVRREVSIDAIGAALERSAVQLGSVLGGHEPSPSSNAHRHEHAVLLADHLAELPPDYREVLILRHCEGLPFKEVARRMGRTAGAARMLWLRAIGQIRERFSAEDLP